MLDLLGYFTKIYSLGNKKINLEILTLMLFVLQNIGCSILILKTVDMSSNSVVRIRNMEDHAYLLDQLCKLNHILSLLIIAVKSTVRLIW